MLSWLATAWRAMVALFAYRSGVSAGKAEQRQADATAAQTHEIEVDHAVQQAEAHAPVGRPALSSRLRDPAAEI